MALPALDTLPPGIGWSWGGGTALAMHLAHRISDDIDIFFTDANALRLLSPQRNPVVKAITGKWQEPGHYIKLECEAGEIDFIVARQFTDHPTDPVEFAGRSMPLETPAEVLAKKLHYRGSRVIARDVFDLAAALEAVPDQLRLAVGAAPEGARRAADSIRRRVSRITRELPGAVRPTAAGERLLRLDPLALAAAIEDMAVD